MPSFNPDLFKLAREEKGLSQKALAEQLGVAQSEISKVESGKKVPGEELVDKAASFFGYTPEFFEQVDVVLPEEGIRHRKRSALSATDRARIEAEARARMLDISVFAKAQGGLVSDLPAREGRSPVEMARVLREEWKVPSCIALNTNPAFPADRQRFTLAHELGHVVLHRDEFAGESAEKRQEKDANAFAGEFLAPEADVADELRPPLTFARLRDLKAKWKMSMGALVHRAADIGILKPSEAKRVWFVFNRYGYRKHEPSMGLVREVPQGVSWLVSDFLKEHGATAVSMLHLSRTLFDNRYPGTLQDAALQGDLP